MKCNDIPARKKQTLVFPHDQARVLINVALIFYRTNKDTSTWRRGDGKTGSCEYTGHHREKELWTY